MLAKSIIELDFSGISEIGQGFADEIFRVFKKAHPNNQIIAVNHNSRIKNMIQHVTASDKHTN